VVDLAKPGVEGEGVTELAGETDKFTEGEFKVWFCTTMDAGEGGPAGDFLVLKPNIKQTYIPAKNTRAMNR
jgi:hypothetical protein